MLRIIRWSAVEAKRRAFAAGNSDSVPRRVGGGVRVTASTVNSLSLQVAHELTGDISQRAAMGRPLPRLGDVSRP